MKEARILLADDHSLVLEGFRTMLEPHFELVGQVKDGRALLTAAKQLQPDVVLLDIGMPLLNGIDAARQLKKIVPKVKLVFLTMHAERFYVAAAFRAGASGYLLKQSDPSELMFAIREVVKGRSYVTPLITAEVVSSFLDSSKEPPLWSSSAHVLTGRQREVLQLVAEGYSLKEIACTLNVSVKTVQFHKSQLMEQLGLHTTAELTKYAIAHGLLSI